MGKAQRSSGEGYCCKHKFDMMTESKMFGSSRRDKTEMASGNSNVSKRKFISLEVDGFDNIPTQVISLSKKSRSQLKELKVRLRCELQQVSIMQKKILSRWPEKVTLSTCNQNRSVNKSDHTENSSQSKPLSSEVNGCQKGDNATSERQVEKIHRAALLRSRFADTILKAQEKTLGLGENWSPNKLKQARMELERQHSKERARLHAEAEALEAKWKRELKREATRLALLKVEKTVEHNEYSPYMRELEMLASYPTGRNPLHQLGLYLKLEEEEDELEEGEIAPYENEELEDGEIDHGVLLKPSNIHSCQNFMTQSYTHQQRTQSISRTLIWI